MKGSHANLLFVGLSVSDKWHVQVENMYQVTCKKYIPPDLRTTRTFPLVALENI